MNGISVYFIHNTRGLPGGSPHSLVFTGFSEEGRSFFLPIFGRLTTNENQKNQIYLFTCDVLGDYTGSSAIYKLCKRKSDSWSRNFGNTAFFLYTVFVIEGIINPNKE